ncbi:MAG: FecR domain-containing protein [Opitutaceae bacterium]|nr:FecR domain-containing protein [Opitutaceae bacterium]
MCASLPLPPDAATRGTLFDRARSQGLAQALAERVAVAVRQQEKRRRKVRRGLGVAGLLIGLGVWAVPYFRSTDEILTQVANRQTVALRDGSHADLNAQTQLRTDFRYGRRMVRLTAGEAFFTVAKDTEHPFLVETPAGTVRVTGTRFNVRLLADRQVEVTLLDGAVAMETSAAGRGRAEVPLAPGQQFRSGDASVHALNAADLERVTAWREGRLMLDEMTVGDAVGRIARYHGKRFEVAPEVASVRLGGSCSLDDLPAFLLSLRATRVIEIIDNRDGSYRVRRQTPPGPP